MTGTLRPAPIVLFVYNRPAHTKETIASLERNTLAGESDLFIYSDAARTADDLPSVQLVREVIDSIPARSAFGSVRILLAKRHRGLAQSVIAGVTQVLEQYGRVIVLEDDLVTSPDFLAFMNDALDRYMGDRRVWSVSGYSPPIDMPKLYDRRIYFAYRASSWGYATWMDRWDGIDWTVSDYRKFRRSRLARQRLNRGGPDMTHMLERQMEGEIDSWAIRWCYAQSKQDALTVYPVQSLVRNIGLDGSGTHSGQNAKFLVSLGDRPERVELCDPFLHRGVLAAFRRIYGSAAEYRRMQLARRARMLAKRAVSAKQSWRERGSTG